MMLLHFLRGRGAYQRGVNVLRVLDVLVFV